MRHCHVALCSLEHRPRGVELGELFDALGL
jgi:hypothetical protein